MRLVTLAQEETVLKVKVDDTPEGVVTVTYRPGALNLEVADQLREVAAGGFEPDALLILLRPILVSWDIENEDGSQLGVSDEEIKKVPLSFLGLLMQAITEDARPNPTTGETLEGTSPQTEKREGSLVTTDSSEQQIGTNANPGNSLG